LRQLRNSAMHAPPPLHDLIITPTFHQLLHAPLAQQHGTTMTACLFECTFSPCATDCDAC
jgi:hypothetical protein